MQNPLIPFLVDKLPTSNNLDDPSLEVLCLLRTLHALNRYWGSLYEGLTRLYAPVINPAEFINSKLTAKVNRQLQDPIIIMTSNLPTWLKEVASICPFLFPFETRQLLFYVTSFDRDRALLRLLDSVPELGAADGGQERVTPDLDRKKRVISRYVNSYIIIFMNFLNVYVCIQLDSKFKLKKLECIFKLSGSFWRVRNFIEFPLMQMNRCRC